MGHVQPREAARAVEGAMQDACKSPVEESELVQGKLKSIANRI